MISAMSTKHQPNPRKRPLEEGTPEFPPTSSLTLEEIESCLEFAKKSQLAIPPISITLKSVFLPLISPHSLQNRFNVDDDDSVFVIIRKSYFSLKNQVESLDLEEFSGIYIRGPVGIGKSYLLYLLAAEYRMNRSSYRVTYVNDCAKWIRRFEFFLLEELIITFYDDTIKGKSISEWCQAVLDSDNEEKMTKKMIASLVDYVETNHITWIVIFDQHNALFDPPVNKDFPFNLINTLADIRGTNVKVIISASAKNEGYPNEIKGWLTHDLLSHRYDDSEFQEWCDHYLLEDNVKVNPDSEEALEALLWTGGIPFELKLLWKQPEKSFAEKIDSYRENRVEEMILSHEKFEESLSDTKKQSLKECVSRMALGLPTPVGRGKIDRQLLEITKDEKG